ncbi:Type I restriction-modification system, specificity subunit S [Cupriavidus necator H850]|uniref:restriction endonuclease subunit S n=1 Tax=Cupriavidus necator TaxID=106590 RepID=UPI00129EDE5E|nr:restriction endonuclease subunit S [Cupriavidus necator]KAI3608371.1 Type I restriction-modification system, specificity subunit S [Cupriavidus necator H850]
MQRYESYKPSGTEWLGNVPRHWDVQPLRAVTSLKSDKNRPDLPVLSVYREYGVILKDSRDDNHNATALDTGAYKVVKPGDLVVNKMKAWQGSMGVSAHDGIVSPAYITCTTKADRIRPAFLHYLLRSSPLIGVYNSLSYGVRVGQWDMHYEDFKRIPIPLPPQEEQGRIVAFLDQKTAEIDAAIAKKERLIEILLEQKQSLIDQAVTTGLDQTIPRHYSEVEWIGDIPLGWEVVPVTKYTKSIVDYRGKTPEKVAAGVFLVTAKNIKNGQIDYATSTEFVSEKDYPKIMARGLPEIGDLLFTTEAPLGEVALVDRTDVAFAQRIIKLGLKRDRLLPKFVVYAMLAGYFQALLAREATGSTALGIKASKLHKLKIAAPSLEQQSRIVEYLDEAGTKIQVLLSRIQGEIESLRDLKANTVASCVTGRVKV